MAMGCDNTYDVVVCGSGGAGLVTALVAADAGLSVAIMEKSTRIGGTTAMSGAGLWIPGNHLAKAAGICDSAAEAMAYISASAPDGWAADAAPHWEAFVEAAPRMLRYLVDRTALRFALTPESDLHLEQPGAREAGRMVSTLPLSRWRLGRLGRRVRHSTMPHLLTYHEMLDWDPFHKPLRAALGLAPKLAWRAATASSAKGSALITALLEACLSRGCHLALGTRAQELRFTEGRVAGIVARKDGRDVTYLARHGVVMATGGFEWNAALRDSSFPFPIRFVGSPAENTGDAITIARQAGVQLARMDQANIVAALPTRYEGRPSALPVRFFNEPNAMLVNRHGQRFASEYDPNIALALTQCENGEPAHLPAWMVTDAATLRSSPLLRWYAGYDRGFMKRARTLADLARAIDVPEAALAASVERFNRFAGTGRDLDFQRGESMYEARTAAKIGKMKPILGPAYVALSVAPSILVTKGGARTTPAGQAINEAGGIVPGLYFVGAAAAASIGTFAIASGTTLGPYLTTGFLCGRALADAATQVAGRDPGEKPLSIDNRSPADC